LIELSLRYDQVQARIADAASKSRRTRAEIELIVVTKTHPASLVAELVDLGQLAFGENKDQEAKPKAELLSQLRPDAAASWHFVGQLQSNKVKSVLSYADVIHSLDRSSLLKELAKQLANSGKQVSAFIELNLTDDPNRGGLAPDSIKQFAERAAEVENLEVLGLMAVAGLGVDPRVDFERVQKHSQTLQEVVASANKLSLGMSADFEQAIEFGATHLRVGSEITGPRGNNT
jgi:pyridoxal phosphate enzyme (YggS family)